MPRPAKYNIDDLLNKSMILFWQKGYFGTSLKDLEHNLDLKAPSIYHAFGNKEQLFIKVIKHYQQQVVNARIQQYLKREAEPLDNIRAFFLSLLDRQNLDDSNLKNEKMGCLMTNTATEFGSSHTEISSTIKKGINTIKKAISSELKRADKNKQLNSNFSIEELASILSAAYQGLLVTLRLNYPQKVLRLNVLSILKVIN